MNSGHTKPCRVCQPSSSEMCDNCLAEMLDDMAREYSEEFNPPTKTKCKVCNIDTLYTTVCMACLDSSVIPF